MDMDKNRRLVTNAAEKYGFHLEFKTKRILEDSGYNVELNQYIKLYDEFIEVDVVGFEEESKNQMVIECKGMESESFLLLIKESKSSQQRYQKYTIRGSKFNLAEFKPEKSFNFFTFTGDFFRCKDQLNKIAKNDDENNFYKAQNQIINAVDAFVEETKSTFKFDRNNVEIVRHPQPKPYIIPLIVTNSNIWVIDYEENTPKANPYKWSLHKVVIRKKGYEGLLLDKIPFFITPVINIKYLSDFLAFVKNVNDEGSINVSNGSLS